ncbi:MAG: peptidylprolyl isomerase [Fimbriimonadaceae bacterium]
MEKSGCGLIVAIALGAVMVVGIFAFGGGGVRRQDDLDGRRLVLAEIGQQKVFASQLDNVVQAQMQSIGAAQTGISPDLMGQVYARASWDIMQGAAAIHLAATSGTPVTDDMIVKQQMDLVEQQIEMQRQTLVLTERLKADATEQEFQEAFRESTGQTLAQVRQSVETQVREVIKDETARQRLAAAAATQALTAAAAQQNRPTDAQLREGFRTWTVRRVLLDPMTGLHADPQGELEKIREEIVGGRMTFAQAMEKHSDDRPQPGKRKSESTVDVPKWLIDLVPDMAPIAELEKDDISGVVRTPEGFAIMQVVSVEDKIPADFNENVETYRNSAAQRMAQRRVQDRVRDAIRQSAKWNEPAFEILYRYADTVANPPAREDDRKAATEALLADIKTQLESGGGFAQRVLSLLQFTVFKEKYDKMTAEQQAEVRQQYIEVISRALDSTEDFGTRLLLASLFEKEEDYASAADQVTMAIASNTNYDEFGLSRYNEARAVELRLLPKLDERSRQNIEEAFRRWRADAVQQILDDSEGNTFYDEAGREFWLEINRRVAALREAGILAGEELRKVEESQARWRTENEKEQARIAEEERAARKRDEEAARREAAEAAPPGNTPARPNASAPTKG